MKYFLAIFGGVLVGIGTGWILLPMKLSTGGVGGIATLIYYVFHIPAGWMALALNIPLFLIAIKVFGFRYSFRTFLSMVATSVAIEVASSFNPLTGDMILASIFGGLITGIGIALTVRGESTTGGTDLIAKLIQTEKKYLNMGDILLIIDGCIIAISSFTFESIEVALYSGIAVFVMTKILDLVLEGANYAKAMFIISDKSEDIQKYIIYDLGLGGTVFDAKGGYSNKNKNVLMCVVNKREIPKIKKKIHEIDDRSFVIITTVNEALGEGWNEV